MHIVALFLAACYQFTTEAAWWNGTHEDVKFSCKIQWTHSELHSLIIFFLSAGQTNKSASPSEIWSVAISKESKLKENL